MKNTTHNARVALTIAIVLGVGISLGGCAAEAGGNGGGNAGSDSSSDSGSSGAAQTDQGATSDDDEDDVSIPDWVTAGFPLYPDSEAYDVEESDGDMIIGFTVPSGEEQAIYEWFVNQYSQKGWDAGATDDVHKSFVATNSDGRVATINVTGTSYVIIASKG